MNTRRLTYLVSRYPAISHTFILREVLRLRALGFDIDVASINDPDRDVSALTSEERDEAARTRYIKATPWTQIAGAHLRAMAARPGGYFSTLAFALSLGGWDARSVLYHVFYFVEAVLVGEWMTSLGHRRLHVHFATPAATVGLIAKQLYPIGLSLTVHGPDEFYDVTRYRLPEKIAGADFLCCIGRFCRSQLMRLSPPAEWRKFEISPLGVDPARFSPRPDPGSEPFEVLCVGRLTPAKGQAVLIEAVRRMHDAGRAIRLRIVGDGPDRSALEDQARRSGAPVIFEGAVNQERIGAFYRQAAAFALPSFAEGIPVVLMEAMAMEIPCVSTTITGIPELILDGREGLLVPPSDAEPLAAALCALMDDPGLRVRLGRAARVKVLEHYNLQTNVERLAEIFERRLACAA